MAVDVLNRLDAAKEAILKAGEELMGFFRTDMSVWRKRGGELISNADIVASGMLYDTLTNRFTGDGYFCEERDEPRIGTSGFSWIVDPLDGSTNFTRGCSDFSISICLVREERPVTGIVYAPYTKELYWASAESGAWVEFGVEGKRQPVRAASTVEISNCIMEFPGGIVRPDRAAKLYEMIGIFYPGVRLRVSECAALTLSRVARGEVDVYIHPTEKPHDFAAGAVIVTEAGGVAAGFSDRVLNVFTRGVLACASEVLYGEIVDRLKNSEQGSRDYWLEEEGNEFGI